MAGARLIKKDMRRTDGGINYGKKGSVAACVENNCLHYKDICKSKKALKEYYCEGLTSHSVLYTCPGKWRLGACI